MSLPFLLHLFCPRRDNWWRSRVSLNSHIRELAVLELTLSSQITVVPNLPCSRSIIITRLFSSTHKTLCNSSSSYWTPYEVKASKASLRLSHRAASSLLGNSLHARFNRVLPATAEKTSAGDPAVGRFAVELRNNVPLNRS